MVATLALTALVATSLAGASSGSGKATELVPITLSTSFGTTGPSAFEYVALEKGYFRDAGFDVTITIGQGTVSVATLIAAGQVDYGPGDTTGVAYARANSGLPVKCVAFFVQKTPSAYFVRADSGINSWKDFVGKSVGDTAGSTGNVLFPLTAKRAGIDPGKVTFVPVSAQTGPGLFGAGKIDIYARSSYESPIVRAAIGGAPVKSFKVADLIPGLAGNCLMVSDAKLKSDPDQVRKITAALLKGLQWSLDNPGAAGAILQKYVPLADYKLAADEIRLQRPFSRDAVTKKKGLGYIDPKRMDATASIVNNFFKPKNRVTRNDIYAPGFLPARPLK